MSKNVFDIGQELMSNAYPGRGIILGRTPDNKKNVIAYFIMGRSENSRNRVFTETEDGIRTRAFDESKMVDPSLIIYHPVRKVGDTLVASESLDVLVNNYIKGEEGTDVAITVYRADKDEYVDMSVTRRKIEVPTVEYSMLDDKIGRIAVSEFDVITVEQFEQAVDELQKDGMEGLIIDLRSNPGGVLDSAVKMVDYILPDDLDQYEKGKGKTLIVYTADKNEKGDVFTASDGHELKMPIVILVNGDSASASEVFTGALKDYDWATVVGTTSYGKGIVQNLIPLGDGSAIKITTAHYYTPSGFDLHGKGIEPDVEVELDASLVNETEISHDEDNQLQTALEVFDEGVDAVNEKISAENGETAAADDDFEAKVKENLEIEKEAGAAQ